MTNQIFMCACAHTHTETKDLRQRKKIEISAVRVWIYNQFKTYHAQVLCWIMYSAHVSTSRFGDTEVKPHQQRRGIPLNRINDIDADVDFVSAGTYAKVKGLLPLFSRPCVSDSHVNSHTRIMHTTWENTQCQKACVYVHSLKQSALHVLLMFTPKHKQTHPRIRARVPGAS